jgi:hypothetical protein
MEWEPIGRRHCEAAETNRMFAPPVVLSATILAGFRNHVKRTSNHLAHPADLAGINVNAARTFVKAWRGWW